MESQGWIGRKKVGKALWCEYAYAFVGPASLSMPLLWVRTLTRCAWVDGPAKLECGATCTSSGVPRVQIPAFGVSMLLTSPALLMPALGANLPVELFVCGLSLMFQPIQVSETSSGHGYRVLVASWRTSVVSFPP